MVVTVLSLGTYFSVAFFDPGFLSYDLRQKYYALADDVITVTATVLDVSAQPVVTATFQCNESTDVLSVLLDWATDVNTSTYDIERNNLLLVAGLTSSRYIDTDVAFNTTYRYRVTAHGPMGPGFATSNFVSVTIFSGCGTTAPIDFSLSVENNDNAVLQGQNLQAVLKITDIAKQYEGMFVPIRYGLINRKGEIFLLGTREALLQKDGETRESFPIPLYMAVGEYSLQAEILLDRMSVSKTVQLSVVAAPLFDLGGSVFITYAGVVRNLGWIVFILLILLLLWSLLFIREYWMYLHAIRHITERYLEKAGLFSKRKGVVR